jgi:hypothetical protein
VKVKSFVSTAYELHPLGPDICTGGGSSRAWAFGMLMTEEFEEWKTEVSSRHDLHATLGVCVIDGPIDAPDHMPAGSTRMDWCPRSTIAYREA